MLKKIYPKLLEPSVIIIKLDSNQELYVFHYRYVPRQENHFSYEKGNCRWRAVVKNCPATFSCCY